MTAKRKEENKESEGIESTEEKEAVVIEAALPSEESPLVSEEAVEPATEAEEKVKVEAKPKRSRASTKKSTAVRPKAQKKQQLSYWGTGRRKSSVARVRLVPGEGKFAINGRPLQEYFGVEIMQAAVLKPLEVTENLNRFDVVVKVSGGGISGQAGAVQHGISRALLQVDETLRLRLKKLGLLTRDPREKERKKYGLKKARKRPQFSKR